MYGFKDKKVAEELRDFAKSRVVTQSMGVERDLLNVRSTMLVRIRFSSGTYGGNLNITWGITMGEEYTDPDDVNAGFAQNEHLGHYKLDWCEAFPIELYDEEDDEDNPRDRSVTSLALNEAAMDQFGDPSAPEPDWATAGNIGNRETIKVHNLSVCPLITGMIVPVHWISNRWVYCGTHNYFAETDSVDGIAPESVGDIYVKGFTYDESVPSSYDFNTQRISGSSSPVMQIWNPWNERIGGGTKVVCGAIGGVACVLGWEC